MLAVKRPLAPEVLAGRHVLIATGGSPWSAHAVHRGVQMAHQMTLSACLLHVENTRVPFDDNTYLMSGRKLLAQAQAAKARSTYECVLAVGPIAETIYHGDQAAVSCDCFRGERRNGVATTIARFDCEYGGRTGTVAGAHCQAACLSCMKRDTDRE